ncbi:hypothetical protein XELAEV_18007058mg [Xenopus laevis]|uniref:Uncharacterized protein n=1 Tax=Xenopus laevis TaxID=8355 RepID=A0A974I4Z0_XENLA|nr:hypothetical protein XELAEV_18007058mg [Xenopus laevis]
MVALPRTTAIPPCWPSYPLCGPKSLGPSSACWLKSAGHKRRDKVCLRVLRIVAAVSPTKLVEQCGALGLQLLLRCPPTVSSSL